MSISSSPEAPDASPRTRLLAAADRLFYCSGVRASGVDALIAEAKIAKATFYRQFPSKDALVLAWLEERSQRWLAWFSQSLKAHGAPQAGLIAVSHVFSVWFHQSNFRGCAILNALTELAPETIGVTALAQRHQAQMQTLVETLLPDNPRRFIAASSAATAMNGAILKAQAGEPDQAITDLEWIFMQIERRVS